jgi:DnaK suppressor protein
MKAAFLKEIRKNLETRKREIQEGVIDDMNGDLNQDPNNMADPTDLATSESDHSFSIRLRERERKLMAKIDEAIDRIDQKTYGICESCGDEIGEGRLRARPVTTLCIQCKTEQEEQERRQTL